MAVPPVVESSTIVDAGSFTGGGSSALKQTAAPSLEQIDFDPNDYAPGSLEAQLHKAIAGSQQRVRDLFASWDVDQDGRLDRSEFYHSLLLLGLDCQRQDANRLFMRLDTDGSGHLDYREIHRVLRNGGSAVSLDTSLQPGALGDIQVEAANRIALRKGEPGSTSSCVVGGLGVVAETSDVKSQLAEALTKRVARVRDLFSEWDVDGSGTVDKKEFYRALRMLGVECTREASDELFTTFDIDRSGEVDYREIHKLLRQGGAVLLDSSLQDGAM